MGISQLKITASSSLPIHQHTKIWNNVLSAFFADEYVDKYPIVGADIQIRKIKTRVF